jgi:hypothetical protein
VCGSLGGAYLTTSARAAPGSAMDPWSVAHAASAARLQKQRRSKYRLQPYLRGACNTVCQVARAPVEVADEGTSLGAAILLTHHEDLGRVRG